MYVENNRLDESTNIEYKSELPSDNSKWLNSIVSFSNTNGGKLYIGIEDETYKVVGINESRSKLENKVANIIYSGIRPLPIIDISFKNIEDKDVLIINVSRGNQTPYYLSSRGVDEGVFVRFGSTDRIATQAQIEELELMGKRTVFSNERYTSLIDQSSYEISKNELNNFLREINSKNVLKEININKLLEWEVILKNFNKYYATNGYMLITSNPFSYAYIRLGVFNGVDKANLYKQNTFEGSLIDQYEAVIDSLKGYLDKGYNFDGVRTKEYVIPEVVIREIIANAIVHRNYLDTHPIRIEVYSDRLSVISPGSLYDGLQLEEMLSGVSKLRNRNVAEIFYSLGYIEKWGSGIQRANHALANSGMKLLDIDDENIHHVIVNIYFEKTGPIIGLEDIKIPTLEQVINYYESKNNTFKRIDLEYDFDITERQARTLIEKLVDNKLIVKMGSGPSTYYEITNR